MTILKNLFFIGAVVSGFSDMAAAAEVKLVASSEGCEIYSMPDDGCQVSLNGFIEPGDAQAVSKIFGTGVNADESGGEVIGVGPTFCLNSSGGSLSEAVKISRLVKEYNASTIILANKQCESACSIIFMAGNSRSIPNRSMHPTAKLGFHAPKLLLPSGTFTGEEVGKAYDLAVATVAEVADLQIMSNYAMILFSSTPSSKMRYIESFFDAREAGVALLSTDLASKGASPFSKLPDQTFVEIVQDACRYVYRREHYGDEPQFGDGYISGFSRRITSEETIKLKSEKYSRIIEGVAFIHQAEEHYEPCKVHVSISPFEANAHSVTVQFEGSAARYFSGSMILWPDSAKVREADQNSLSHSELARRLSVIGAPVKPMHCYLGGEFASVVNVQNFVNVRRTASLNAEVVTTAPRDVKVKIMEPAKWWYQVTDQGSACSNLCQAYSRNPTDSSVAEKVRQCINQKQIWAKVRHDGQIGFVSTYFLEVID